MTHARVSSALSTQASRELLQVAEEAACEAAEIARSGFRAGAVADTKGRNDLVTSFDRECERLLRDRLHQRTPYPVTGEEGGADGSIDALRWHVDPIDGTTNFVHGHPMFCVSVGLLRGGDPVLGVVMAPVLLQTWKGIVGQGTFRNGETVHVSRVARLGEAFLATGFPTDRSDADLDFEAFAAVKKRCQAVRRCGSAALDLCFVADGTYDGYWERKVKTWDVAAGAAMVLGAGGQLSCYDGSPVGIRDGDIVATNGHIHDELCRELSAVFDRR